MPPKKCGPPSCKLPPIATCRGDRIAYKTDPDTHVTTATPTGEKCGMMLCGFHVRNGIDGTPRCLWHYERERERNPAPAEAAP